MRSSLFAFLCLFVVGCGGSSSDDYTAEAVDENRTISKSEMEKLYEKLINQVRVGTSVQELKSLLGDPTEINDHDLNNKVFSMWTWASSDDSDAIISLIIEKGAVTRGGTPGYDIRTGFKSAP